MSLQNPWTKNKINANTNVAVSIHIPERFEREVSLHIFKNYFANIERSFKTPLILAISGAPGTGKTFQTTRVLETLNITPYIISGAEFEDEHAGIPVKNLRNQYIEISEDVYYNKNSKAAIIIEDIDAALGQWGGLVQYTMNRQLLIKTLIDFADNPYKISYCNEDGNPIEHQTQRIPIIVTLNDETKMYEPLMRNGRCTIFPWIPSTEDMTNILRQIFHNTELEYIMDLVYDDLLRYAQSNINPNITTLPISLFSDIKSSLYDDFIWGAFKSNKSFNEIIESFKDNLTLKDGFRSSFTMYDAISIGKKLLRKNKNYLSERN